MKIRQDRNDYNIGRNIRKHRILNHLTQEQTVARMQLLGIEISRGTYSHIECGIDNIKVEELLALAEIFHVSIENFFEGMTFPSHNRNSEVLDQ
ncbi:MAG: helix-turn-helix transcriptional regulator [Lachnospiraceae bacterium]|jgi:transcriptional regulator with XRE-family HTH domain|nr:helix-turn-helix transcriptional regulator [Lachnospiraceae bacterium]